MNILTIDKAIDSPRYITFQSIADTKVKFIYPNLFKVEVYKLGKNLEGKNVAVLKTIPEIKTAIKTYLKNQVDVYNNLLTLNENNNNSNKNA
ncbi:hypothetical protein IJM86_01145 [bacterium]|nr:hypothetical protein [bacterium]